MKTIFAAINFRSIFLSVFLVYGFVFSESVHGDAVAQEEASMISDKLLVGGPPSFSRNGSTMVFPGLEESILGLYNSQSKELKKIKAAGPVLDPEISADGKKIYYGQLSEQGYIASLWGMDSETMDKFRLTGPENGDIYRWTLSPDGAHIVFFSFTDKDNRQSISFIDLSKHDTIHRVGGDIPWIKVDHFIRPVFSPDSMEVYFPFKEKIYCIDVATRTLSNVFDAGMPVHFLSACSDCLVYVSHKQGYYQIFTLNMKNGTIQQLTNDKSHKLLPSVDKAGHLYYLDIGKSLSSRNLTSLVWLMGRTGASIFKDYRQNDWGRIAWGQSYTLEFLLTAYKAFADEYFITEYVTRAKNIINSMDLNRNIQDYEGISTYGWSSTRYSVDKKTRVRRLVHAGMIGAPMAEFIKTFKERNRSKPVNPEISEMAEKLYQILCRLIKEHDFQWIDPEMDPLRIADKNEGYYICPRKSPISTDGINLPFNHQNKFGTLLILMYEIDGNADYLDKAKRLGRVFRRHLLPDGTGFKWHYWWGTGFSGWKKSDGFSTYRPKYKGNKRLDAWSYATMELEFAVKLARHGVFDDNDLLKFANTLLNPNSELSFDNVKAAALLAGVDKEVKRKMNFIQVLDEPWQSIPFIALIHNDNTDTSWRIKKGSLKSSSDHSIFFESKDLAYFSLNGENVSCIVKRKNQPYSCFVMAGN